MYPWAISQIHIHIANTLAEIPQNPQGSPQIGQFAINNTYDPPISGTMDPNTNLYYIPFTYPTALTGSEFFVAVHAVVCTYGGTEGFNFYLPNGQISYTVNYNSPASYFKVSFLEGSGFLSGTGPYESFCVDADLNIYPPATLTGQIYSSYESLPSNLQTAIDNWENLDLVNWLLNTYPVGSYVPQYSYSILPTTEKGIPYEGTFTSLSPSTGQVTWQDLQAAIWALLEDGDIDGKPLSQAWQYLQPQSALTYNNVWGLVYAALNSAPPNFVPGCNQSMIAILVPDNPQGNMQIITIQPTLMTLQMPCSTQCETAWGDGLNGANFVPNSNWSTYFKWNINDCTIPNK
jgi:hypothetical protein